MKRIEGGLVGNKLEMAVMKKALDEVRQDVGEVWKGMHDLKSKPAEFLSTGLTPRPNPSPFFVGRQKETRILMRAVKERGSKAITGLGGVGKTQLMATFVERAELDGNVPGGVFWLSADGEAADVLESLAIIAEKILGRKMRHEDRVSREVVVDTVRKGMNKRNGRWLLCVDNVDYAGNPDVNIILGTLTSMEARNDG